MSSITKLIGLVFLLLLVKCNSEVNSKNYVNANPIIEIDTLNNKYLLITKGSDDDIWDK